MNTGSASLRLDSNRFGTTFEAIDCGRFSEAQNAIGQRQLLAPLDHVAAAEIALYFGRLSDAEAALQQVGPAADNLWLASRTALAEGELLFARRNFSSARNKFTAAFYFSEFLKDHFSIALAVYRNSRILSAQGQHEDAIRMLHEAYEGLRGQGTKAEFLRGLIDFQLAVCERNLGHVDESEQLYRSAIDSLKESERGRYYAIVLISHGIVERESGNLQRALESFEEAMNILNRNNIFDELTGCLCELSAVLIQLRSYDRAESLLAECLDLYKKTDDPDGEAKALIITARMELERNRPRKAREHATRAYEMPDLLKSPSISASARILLARSSTLEKERAKAVQLLEEAAQIADSNGLVELKIEALIYLAEAYHSVDPLKGPSLIEAATIILKDHGSQSLEVELMRISQKYQSGRIWSEGSKLIFDSNLLPNWYEAKRALELFLLKGALEQSGQNLTEAGKLLGISKVHVHDKRKQYQI